MSLEEKLKIALASRGQPDRAAQKAKRKAAELEKQQMKESHDWFSHFMVDKLRGTGVHNILFCKKCQYHWGQFMVTPAWCNPPKQEIIEEIEKEIKEEVKDKNKHKSKQK